jgi:hypothetical protein
VSPNRTTLDERFAGTTLDPDVWFPYYLPHWSSRSQSAATYAVSDGELRLSIPADQPLWCADLHKEPMRVSGVQSGSFAGELGSRIGQQPFRPDLVVREEQPTFHGYTPQYARVAVTMRAVVSERSMVAFWMSGFEDQPERSGEICVAEIFGDSVRDGSAEVGMGVHAFRDRALREDFAAPRLALDVTHSHTYAVDWRPEGIAISVDDTVVRELDQSPAYPMQLMLGVFDFPDRAAPEVAAIPVPELVVSRVQGSSE